MIYVRCSDGAGFCARIFHGAVVVEALRRTGVSLREVVVVVVESETPAEQPRRGTPRSSRRPRRAPTPRPRRHLRSVALQGAPLGRL